MSLDVDQQQQNAAKRKCVRTAQIRCSDGTQCVVDLAILRAASGLVSIIEEDVGLAEHAVQLEARPCDRRAVELLFSFLEVAAKKLELAAGQTQSLTESLSRKQNQLSQTLEHMRQTLVPADMQGTLMDMLRASDFLEIKAEWIDVVYGVLLNLEECLAGSILVDPAKWLRFAFEDISFPTDGRFLQLLTIALLERTLMPMTDLPDEAWEDAAFQAAHGFSVRYAMEMAARLDSAEGGGRISNTLFKLMYQRNADFEGNGARRLGFYYLLEVFVEMGDDKSVLKIADDAHLVPLVGTYQYVTELCGMLPLVAIFKACRSPNPAVAERWTCAACRLLEHTQLNERMEDVWEFVLKKEEEDDTHQTVAVDTTETTKTTATTVTVETTEMTTTTTTTTTTTKDTLPSNVVLANFARFCSSAPSKVDMLRHHRCFFPQSDSPVAELRYMVDFDTIMSAAFGQEWNNELPHATLTVTHAVVAEWNMLDAAVSGRTPKRARALLRHLLPHSSLQGVLIRRSPFERQSLPSRFFWKLKLLEHLVHDINDATLTGDVWRAFHDSLQFTVDEIDAMLQAANQVGLRYLRTERSAHPFRWRTWEGQIRTILSAHMELGKPASEQQQRIMLFVALMSNAPVELIHELSAPTEPAG